MEAVARFKSGLKFEVEARGHVMVSDQPLDNGGADGGMTPPEMLLGALASCAGFYAVQYLKARSLPHAGLNVKVTAEKAAQPARLGSFKIEIETPPLDARHQEGVMRAAKACLIHNTLLGNPKIETEIKTLDPAPVESVRVPIESGYGNLADAAPAGWRA